MNYEPIPNKATSKQKKNKNGVDKFKLQYLERLMKDCKKHKTDLIFVVSPMYKPDNRIDYSAVDSLCRLHKVPFLYYENDERFCETRKYFKDTGHLNHEGATAYTKFIVGEIRSILKTNETWYSSNRGKKNMMGLKKK